MRCMMVTASLLFASALAAGEFDASTFNGPALKINTQIVSIREVETVFADSMALINDRVRKGELTAETREEAIRKAWTEALDTTIQDKILDQRADRRRKEIMKYYLARSGENYVNSDRALEAFRRLEAEYASRLRREMINAAGGEEELRAALKRRGQTMRQWEDGISRELFRRDVIAMELGPVTTPPSTVRAFYDKNPELFSQPESWKLRRIRIAKDKFSSAEVAREAARMVKEKIEAGADFGEIAAKVSADPEFAQQGGLLTRDSKAELPAGTFPLEERIAATIKDGVIADAADAGQFLIIVQRVAHKPRLTLPFEQAVERAEALAYAEKLKQKKREMFEKLKHETYIEVLQKNPPDHLLGGAPDKGTFVDPDQ